MSEDRITFFCEDISYHLTNESGLIKWLEDVAIHYKKHISYINYVFCSDDYLLNINQTYLNHDYYTDIITFDQSENDGIAADIFISIDRVNENAQSFSISHEDELHRVLVHGLLHLIGFNDKSEEEKKEMKENEEACLSLRKH